MIQILEPIDRSSVWLKKTHRRQLSILASLAHNTSTHKNRHMQVIIYASSRAETQYALLIHYYKCAGIIEQSPTSHKYRLLKKWEEDRIKQMRMQNISLLHIAAALNRHISTVYYACKRLNV